MYKLESFKSDNKEFFLKRVFNIKYFANLDRSANTRDNPKKDLIETFNDVEEIYIVYPGIESSGFNVWDFRPLIKKGIQSSKNLEFGEIWNSIDNFIQQSEDKIKTTKQLIELFYKIAFMKCHEKDDFYKISMSKMTTDEKNLLKQEINILDSTKKPMEVSLYSLLFYNDLIANNEDSKYFYKEYTKNAILKSGTIKNISKFLDVNRNQILKKRKNSNNKSYDFINSTGEVIHNSELKNAKSYINLNKRPEEILSLNEYEDLKNTILWSNDVGRVNTCCTHINVLLHIYKNESPYQMLQDCMNRKGIFNIKIDDSFINFLNS